MRLLIQRVKRCSVTVGGEEIGRIGEGMLVFLGVKSRDTEDDAEFLARKCVSLRIFDDESGKMNLSVKEIKGEILVVSQFTLYGDAQKGNRPDYTAAAAAPEAERLYEYFIGNLRRLADGLNVATGVFRAMMDVELVNDGPVTLILDSKANNAGG
jgi:D-tyrosyl-tRNA(Tyr) deacylase